MRDFRVNRFAALTLCAFILSLVVTGCEQEPDSPTIPNPNSDDVSGDGNLSLIGASDFTRVTLPDGVPLEMVRITSGSFLMGRYSGEQGSLSTEDPQHTVTIAYDFSMGKYEVTKAQWQAVMSTTPWSRQNWIIDHPQSPAIYLSWNDIAGSGGFIEKLNRHIASTGQGPATFRLPSEAEWEYSCRAGTTTRFYWGDDPFYTQIGNYAWYQGNAYDGGEIYAHVVGRKLPNAWGLFDMSGNAYEWCEDVFHLNFTGALADGSPWVTPNRNDRVLRGGFQNSVAKNCRSAARYDLNKDVRRSYSAFRLLRTQN